MKIYKPVTFQLAWRSQRFGFAVLCLLPLLFSRWAGAAIVDNDAPCSLPPDFWCDHPEVSLACTGSSAYCDNYRANRQSRPLQMNLAFESACPDSQQFVVHRLYPKVLSQSDLTPSMVNFKAVPWGLARRQTESSVRCHHGERECTGNRLLTCALLHYQQDDQKRNQLLYCFMQKMMSRGDPNLIIDQCLNQLAAPAQQKESITSCGRGPQATDLQKADEAETGKILSTPRFVPFISINGVGHIHMQAHQMILNEKVRAWDNTVKKSAISRNANSSSQCNLPPDFWCSDPAITSNCYSATGCVQYLKGIYGKPVQINVIFNPQLATSRKYVLGYLKPNFMTASNAQNDQKVVLELEPAPIAAPSLAQCDAGCQEQGLQECVAAKVSDVKERNNQLVCLMEAKGATATGATSIKDLWVQKCARDETIKENVVRCFDTQAWRQLTTQRAAKQQALRPEPRRGEPWVVINGFSLESVQSHAHILHRMICLWYRGPNHNREHCARCEYEPTSC